MKIGFPEYCKSNRWCKQDFWFSLAKEIIVSSTKRSEDTFDVFSPCPREFVVNFVIPLLTTKQHKGEFGYETYWRSRIAVYSIK